MHGVAAFTSISAPARVVGWNRSNTGGAVHVRCRRSRSSPIWASSASDGDEDVAHSEPGRALLVRCAREFPKSAAVGVAAGAVGSMIGAGGGIVLTPLLTSFMHLSQHEAHGTSLVAVAANSLVSAFVYNRAGAVVPQFSVLLCLFALSTSYFGAIFSARVDSARLRRFFGIFLLIVSALLLLPRQLSSSSQSSISTTAPTLSDAKRILPVIVSGLVTGFVSGLLGIGGGTVMVPALVFGAQLPQKLAQGTALAAMILPSLLACSAHLKLGHIRNELLPGILCGVFVGANAGGTLAVGLPDRALRACCAVVFTATAFKYLLGASKKKT